MSSLNRRDFMGRTAGLTLGMAGRGNGRLAVGRSPESPRPTNGYRLAVVGIRGRGRHLARDFASQDDCLVTYLCDVDQSLFDPRAKEVEEIQVSRPRAVSLISAECWRTQMWMRSSLLRRITGTRWRPCGHVNTARMSSWKNRSATRRGKDEKWWRPPGGMTGWCRSAPKTGVLPIITRPNNISRAVASARSTSFAYAIKSTSPISQPRPINRPLQTSTGKCGQDRPKNAPITRISTTGGTASGIFRGRHLQRCRPSTRSCAVARRFGLSKDDLFDGRPVRGAGRAGDT